MHFKVSILLSPFTNDQELTTMYVVNIFLADLFMVSVGENEQGRKIGA